MFQQTEAKAQCWRAVAILENGVEALLLVGRSSTQVRENYLESYLELLDDEERSQVQSIAMQRWHGAPDAGRWMHQSELKIPDTKLKLVRVAA
jgi:hypothetical protein